MRRGTVRHGGGTQTRRGRAGVLWRTLFGVELLDLRFKRSDFVAERAGAFRYGIRFFIEQSHAGQS